jgi:hypothetical protein
MLENRIGSQRITARPKNPQAEKGPLSVLFRTNLQPIRNPRPCRTGLLHCQHKVHCLSTVHFALMAV